MEVKSSCKETSHSETFTVIFKKHICLSLLSQERRAWNTGFRGTIFWGIWFRGERVKENTNLANIWYQKQPTLRSTDHLLRGHTTTQKMQPIQGIEEGRGYSLVSLSFAKMFFPQGSNSLKLLYYRWIARLRGTVRLHCTNSVGIHAKMAPVVVVGTETMAATLVLYAV